ncbi:MAG: class GN sortase [Pseudomarimonas sp.]
MAALVTLAVALTLNASYIHVKAALAQILLTRAWDAMRGDGQPQRPWPWADNHPVARLRMQRLHIDQIVLAGDSGRTIAFGPGWAEASAAPGSDGTTIISAHRDTHFDWLRKITPNDLVELESTHGVHRYRVVDMHIADSRTEQLSLSANANQLILVTCWPFGTVVSGGPLRFVVVAEHVVERAKPKRRA